jgi:hypothetical protein
MAKFVPPGMPAEFAERPKKPARICTLPSPGPVGWAFPPAASEAAIDASTLATPVACAPLLAPVYQPVSTVLSPKPIT